MCFQDLAGNLGWREEEGKEGGRGEKGGGIERNRGRKGEGEEGGGGGGKRKDGGEKTEWLKVKFYTECMLHEACGYTSLDFFFFKRWGPTRSSGLSSSYELEESTRHDMSNVYMSSSHEPERAIEVIKHVSVMSYTYNCIHRIMKVMLGVIILGHAHMIPGGRASCVCLVLHGYEGPDAGEFLLISLLSQWPTFHYHPAPGHPGCVFVTLMEKGEEGRKEEGGKERGQTGLEDVVFLILWSTVLHITHQCESARFIDNNYVLP